MCLSRVKVVVSLLFISGLICENCWHFLHFNTIPYGFMMWHNYTCGIAMLQFLSYSHWIEALRFYYCTLNYVWFVWCFCAWQLNMIAFLISIFKYSVCITLPLNFRILYCWKSCPSVSNSVLQICRVHVFVHKLMEQWANPSRVPGPWIVEFQYLGIT